MGQQLLQWKVLCLGIEFVEATIGCTLNIVAMLFRVNRLGLKYWLDIREYVLLIMLN